MQLLKEQNFFNWRREDFFLKSLKEGISTEVSTLDINEVRRLELKYSPEMLSVKSQRVLVF